jgi:hypothetical protein
MAAGSFTRVYKAPARKVTLKKKAMGRATLYKGKSTLATKVNYLMKMNKVVKQTNFYKDAHSTRIGSGAYVFGTESALSIDQFPLTHFPNYTRVFGTQPNDEVNQSCRIKTLAIKMALDIRNFNTRTPGYSVFIVSPTKLCDTNFDPVNGTFRNLDMNKHYTVDLTTDPLQVELGHDCQPDTVFLNLKYFNIHYYRNFRLGNADDNVNPTDTKSSVKEMKFNLKKPIMVTNPSGDWKDLPSIADTAKNLVMLVFCNRTGIPGQYNSKIDYNSLIGIETSA